MYALPEDIRTDRAREVWRSLFSISSGFVYVVDVSQLEQTRLDLEMMLDDECMAPNSPLLVLATAPAGMPTPVSVLEITRALRLGEYRNLRWSVRYYEVQSMAGLIDGLAWLAGCL